MSAWWGRLARRQASCWQRQQPSSYAKCSSIFHGLEDGDEAEEAEAGVTAVGRELGGGPFWLWSIVGGEGGFRTGRGRSSLNPTGGGGLVSEEKGELLLR